MSVAPLEGSLASRDVPALIKTIHEHSWTGTIALTHMGVGKNVIVQGGRLIFASSTSRDDRLGEVLLRRGKISLQQYIESGRLVGGGRRLGTILVERNAIAPRDLVNGVVEQTCEIIYGVFQWSEGHYRLAPDAIPAEAITLNINTPDIILEGIRRIESWSRIERAVGGPETRYCLTPHGADIVSRLTLSADKIAIATGLTSTKTVAQICSASSLSNFETCRTLWAFQSIGAVRRAEPEHLAMLEDEGLDSVLTQELPDAGS